MFKSLKIAGLIGWAVILLATSPVWGLEVGEPLPGFAMRTFDDKVITSADLTGQPALVVFWNTWCAVCMHEMPQIDRLHKAFGSDELKIVAINSAINDSEKKARAYQKKQGYEFAFVFDKFFDLGQAFSIRGVPSIFLTDTHGVVRAKFSQIPEDLPELIRQLHAGGTKTDRVSNP